ncbi:hypothetical protein ACLOJK_028218, partial [Asimina triloba]
ADLPPLQAAVGGRQLMWADAGSWADGEDAAGPSSAAIDVDDEMGFNPSGFGRSCWRDAHR